MREAQPCRSGKQLRAPPNLGRFFILIEVQRLDSGAWLAERMQDFAQILHSSQAVEADKPVIVAGEIEQRNLARPRAQGIALSPEVFAMLQARQANQPLTEASMRTFDQSVIDEFSPTGRLRAAINLGNPILARRASNAEPAGVSVDLANAFARQLGVDIELVVFDTAGKSVEAVTTEQADIGFFAVDPVRGAGISFTAPYVLIEGAYLVRAASPMQRNAEVDVAGVRVVVGKGSAYDLHLTRELQSAAILRAPTSPTVVETFLEQGAEVAAGVKQQLEFEAARLGGLRLLPGRFMVIQQAMGLPKARSAAAAQVLSTFVEEMKRSGFVQQALKLHGIEGASVAPRQ